MHLRTYTLICTCLILIIGALSYIPLSAKQRGHNDAMAAYRAGNIVFTFPAGPHAAAMMKDLERLNEQRRIDKKIPYSYQGISSSPLIFWQERYWDSHNRTLLDLINEASP